MSELIEYVNDIRKSEHPNEILVNYDKFKWMFEKWKYRRTKWFKSAYKK